MTLRPSFSMVLPCLLLPGKDFVRQQYVIPNLNEPCIEAHLALFLPSLYPAMACIGLLVAWFANGNVVYLFPRGGPEFGISGSRALGSWLRV